MMKNTTQNQTPGFCRQETNPDSLKSYTSSSNNGSTGAIGARPADPSDNKKRIPRSQRKASANSIRIPRAQRIEWNNLKSSQAVQDQDSKQNETVSVPNLQRLATRAHLGGPRAA